MIETDQRKAFLKEETKCDFTVSTFRKQIWLKELEMFEAFRTICEKNELTYYLTGGSLLGAVRHQGFIPWDDDFDVGMPREDYEKFIKIAAKELRYPLMLQTHETDPEFLSCHAKIRNVETTAIRYDEWADEHQFCQGIFFDIFPYDNIPDGKLTQKIHRFRAQFYRHILNNGPLFNRKRSTFFRKLAYAFSMVFCLFIPVEKQFEIHEKVCQKYNKKKTKRWGLVSTFYEFPNLYYNKEDFKEVITVPFEYTDAQIPAAYDSVLKTQYGDWHKLVKGSNCHGEVFFDVDKSWKEYINQFEKYKETNQII